MNTSATASTTANFSTMEDAAQPAQVRGQIYSEIPDSALDIVRVAREVQIRTGKSAGRQMLELVGLTVTFPRVTPAEYYDMHLYDNALTKAQKREFMGGWRWYKLAEKYNAPEKAAPIIDDKLVFNRFMTPNFPLVRVKALFATGGRAGKFAELRDEKSLRAFLGDPAHYPMFGKPMTSSLSLGAGSFMSLDVKSQKLKTSAGEVIDLDIFIELLMQKYSDRGYLFQDRVEPHPEIRAICGDRAACVRVVTVTTDKTEIFGVVWKVPAGNNVADNFWRAGNILAQLKPETGEVLRAFRGTGIDEESITEHPDTGRQLVGFRMPNWQTILNTAKDVAEVFPHKPIIGWDIVATAKGCLIIEGNTHPDLRLHQMADRKGAYNQQMKTMMQHAKQKRKKNRTERLKERRKYFVKNIRLALERKARAH